MEEVILGITKNDYEFNKLTDALKDEKQRPFVCILNKKNVCF